VLVWVRDGRVDEFRVPPESLGLCRATKANVPWKDSEDEARCLLGALAGEEGPVHDLILYNAALRLWIADEAASLEDHLEEARAALRSGGALELVDRLRGRVSVSG
jgi:anthranilate phosphoribosyltransferase